MDRPSIYMAQVTAIAEWLRTQGDGDGAVLADELIAHLQIVHDGAAPVIGDDPAWAVGAVIENDPAIRCHPAAGVVILGPDGPVLTIDPMDGGNVSLVHLGDVLEWRRGRELAADAVMHPWGRAADEAKQDADRAAYDATVGSGYEEGDVDVDLEDER